MSLVIEGELKKQWLIEKNWQGKSEQMGCVRREEHGRETESAQIDSQPVLEAVQAVSTKEGGWTGMSQGKIRNLLISLQANAGELEDLRLIEEPRNAAQMWSRFEKLYPKIQAFDSEHGCEILVWRAPGCWPFAKNLGLWK